MPECLPLQQFHGDEGGAFVLVHVVNSADVGMIQGGGSLRLALKASQGLMVLGQFTRQKLERSEPPEPGVLGLIDHTHPAAAKLLYNAVMLNHLPNHVL